jgi:hypothetical protein
MRLPSFNDFSPEILKGDLRPCLAAIERHAPNDKSVIEEWASAYFHGKSNKRSTTNIPATLTSTGLIARQRPFALTDFGRRVAGASNAVEAAEIFCRGLLEQHNGVKVIEAVRELAGRGEPVTKKSLKQELERLGITRLSTNTTDHTTLKNWMFLAGILKGDAARPTVDDAVLKRLIGISDAEQDQLAGLSLAQQVFVQLLRKRHETEAGPFLAKDLLQECLGTHPHLFAEDQFARAVRIPLEKGGWLSTTGLAAGPQGGKSGKIIGTDKLVSIPLDKFIPDFAQLVPADLRKRIRTPLTQILDDLNGADDHKGGLALELLALRMILDLRLEPRGFRLRSKDTAYAEVDVTAEAKNLLFSRWVFQCKRVKSRVGLSEVAKEVGIAVYTRAHVVVMVTTSSFSEDAYQFARQISRFTPLQFLFLPGTIVRRYLSEGPAFLREHVLNTAGTAMVEKRGQASWQKLE